MNSTRQTGGTNAMMRTPLVILLVLAIGFLGCGKSAEQKKLEEAAKGMGEATQKFAEGAEKMSDALKEMNEGKKYEPVDFRELRALIPESLPGLTRGNLQGERSGAMGVDVAYASADYTNESGMQISVKISDMGSLTGPMRMATLGWTIAKIDREDDEGYEKTGTFNGYTSWERNWKATKHSEVNILVAGRFVVQLDGDSCDMNQLKDAAAKIDLGKLASMKEFGATS
jgi:hypothetical protein